MSHEAPQDNVDEDNAEEKILSTRSSTKVYDHVPPRVDPDKYQADIPPLLNQPGSDTGMSKIESFAICR